MTRIHLFLVFLGCICAWEYASYVETFHRAPPATTIVIGFVLLLCSINAVRSYAKGFVRRRYR